MGNDADHNTNDDARAMTTVLRTFVFRQTKNYRPSACTCCPVSTTSSFIFSFIFCSLFSVTNGDGLDLPDDLLCRGDILCSSDLTSS